MCKIFFHVIWHTVAESILFYKLISLYITFQLLLSQMIDISYYLYLKVNFLGPENLLKVSIFWDELQLCNMESLLYMVFNFVNLQNW